MTASGREYPAGVAAHEQARDLAQVRLAKLQGRIGLLEAFIGSNSAGAKNLLRHTSEVARSALDDIWQGLTSRKLQHSRRLLEARGAVDSLRSLLAGVPRDRSLITWQRHVLEASADTEGAVAALLAQAPRSVAVNTLANLKRFRAALQDLHLLVLAARADKKERAGLASDLATLRANVESQRCRLSERRRQVAIEWREFEKMLGSELDAIEGALERFLG